MSIGDRKTMAGEEPQDEIESDGSPVVIDPRLDQLIGRSLESHYDDILQAPLPDKFIVLLAQLDAKERSS